MVEIAARYNAPAHLHLRVFDSTRDWGELFEVFGVAIHTGGDLHVNHPQCSTILRQGEGAMCWD
jgi:hypothetical protein